ncbi:MAG: isocitrate lyase/phosphoenolpyruvate mutase family protein [Planctomycetes bacterium]|nr:isocitrate lyase/phosphoenolpyruvate mutase family protein [Planctomycetota bacterium]
MSPGIRDLLAKELVIMEAGIYDCISARAAADAGFHSLFLTGYGVSASLLGKADASFVNLTDFELVCRNVTRTVDLPVIVDVDTGFGNAINAAHTVRVIEHAGGAGIHLEDQVAPKRCIGSVTGVNVVPIDEAVGKIKAAVDARRDPDFLIEVTCMEPEPARALERAHAYAEAGADVIGCRVFHSLEGLIETQRVTGKPVFVVYTDPPGWVSIQQLQEHHVSAVAIFAVETVLTAYRAMCDALTYLREGKEMSPSAPRVKLLEFSRFIGFPEITALEHRYLPQEQAHTFRG